MTMIPSNPSLHSIDVALRLEKSLESLKKWLWKPIRGLITSFLTIRLPLLILINRWRFSKIIMESGLKSRCLSNS